MANHLIIGLGGTGGQILAGLRKRIYAELGKREVTGTTNIDYLYVDSSEKDLNDKSNWTYMGEALHLMPDQKVNIHGIGSDVLSNPRQYPGIGAFLSDRDRELMQNDQVLSIISAGIGGQRRRFGRMLLANNVQTNDSESSLVARLRSKTLKLTSGGDGNVQFHVCAGLAGGTGSGSIVDVVSQIRKITAPMGRAFSLYLYLYIPEILVEANCESGFYHANGFAALSELNAMALKVYNPTDISGEIDVYTGQVARLLKDCDAFTKAFLFTNYNEVDRVLPKNGRLPEAVADFLFQKTVAVSLVPGGMGNMQRLEDSENDGDAPEKDEAGANVHSRDFMTFGIKRVEYPESEIKEYVTYNYAVQAARQLEFNLWIEGKGYTTCTIDEVGMGYRAEVRKAETLEALKLTDNHLTLQAAIREIKGVTESWESFNSYWTNICQFFGEQAAQGGDKRSWPAVLLDFCETEYKGNFRGVGVQKFFETQRSESKGYAAFLKRHIESRLFKDWQTGEKSLLEVEKYIQVLIDYCEEHLGAIDERITQNRSYLDNDNAVELAEIENDWNNIGWLSDAITGKSRKVFDRYKQNRCDFFSVSTEMEGYKYAKILMADIISQLNGLLRNVGDFKESLNQLLRTVSDAAESKCKVETTNTANVREVEVLDKKYNPAQIRELTGSFVIDVDEQKRNAREIREEMVNRLGGEDHTFTMLNTYLGDIDTLSKCFIQICSRNAVDMMNRVAEKDHTMKMLEVNILEKIKQECNTPELLENYVHKLVEQAKCFMQFNPTEMGKMVAGQPASKMGRMIQLCLPAYNDPTNFRDRFIQAFASQCGAYCTFNPGKDVAENYRSSQIVIVAAASAFPLRYIQNIKFLQDKYKSKVMGRDGELNAVLLHTESNLRLPELFEASAVDKRMKLLPYAILVHSMGVLQQKTDPNTGGTFMAVGIGSGFSRKWLRVGKNMEETTHLLISDGALAKSITDYVDGVLAAEYKLNDKRAALREAIETAVCDTILPMVNDNDQDPLFEEYRKAAEKLFSEQLAER